LFFQGFSHFWPSTSAPLSVESYPSRAPLASRRPCSTGAPIAYRRARPGGSITHSYQDSEPSFFLGKHAVL
jgi:hypothetical protein